MAYTPVAKRKDETKKKAYTPVAARQVVMPTTTIAVNESPHEVVQYKYKPAIETIKALPSAAVQTLRQFGYMQAEGDTFAEKTSLFGKNITEFATKSKVGL